MRLAALIAAALVLAPAAAGSITVATNATRPALRVDAQGSAEVSWTAGGARHTLLVPSSGLVRPGVRLAGKDVGRQSPTRGIPFARVVRQGSGGWLYALQSWQVLPSGPVELRFSRWRGAPTVAKLTATKRSTGVLLTGTVTFAGKPVPTTSRTPEGKVLRQYAYLDVATGGTWKRLGGVAVRAGGTFRRLAPHGTRFRVVAPGSNIGRTEAPDAIAVASVA